MIRDDAKTDFVEYRKNRDIDKVALAAPSKIKSTKSNVCNKTRKMAVKRCDCQGMTHEIVANCIKCGKLYCSSNHELTNCDFCNGFVADPRSSGYEAWFEQQMQCPDFFKAIKQRDRMIEHES
ncbi:conserved Plasmodium protein, unknown function [Babesia microti strain RI]|uniref:TRIP4/RQT4 C2HC5-type zinc finger domain-containing protein n=1 Tax=Babesia microti (strain RI) TaxID=1133968 RepID=A0A1R4AB64_BABMR|nr:conserved Plasmodium protein, unknown function [Babesia microti strain RI]SJK86251.1 conserved Plasmodium protein, unknown function [Babesia microti strain RI]|eukprot:XP_021338433.1 conserved Plasmodium protein, unknown function [Babesia microti strain RI]